MSKSCPLSPGLTSCVSWCVMTPRALQRVVWTFLETGKTCRKLIKYITQLGHAKTPRKQPELHPSFTFLPRSWLESVDFPALGAPMMAILSTLGFWG